MFTCRECLGGGVKTSAVMLCCVLCVLHVLYMGGCIFRVPANLALN